MSRQMNSQAVTARRLGVSVVTALAVGLAIGASSARADSNKPADDLNADLSVWRTVPVFHSGRVMPMDTLAKVAAETICGAGTRVKLQLAGYYTPEQLKDEQLQPALELFPAGEQRKMQAVEVLLSWLAESEKWEDVPFLLCEHNDLHAALGIESQTAGGLHRKFISPRMVAESEELIEYLEDHRDRRQAAQSARGEFEPTDTDKLVLELLNRYRIWRKLTLDPRLELAYGELLPPGGRDEFLSQLMAAVDTLGEEMQVKFGDGTRPASMLTLLQGFIEHQDESGEQGTIVEVARLQLAALEELRRMASQLFPQHSGGEDETPLSLKEVESMVVLLRRASIRLADAMGQQKEMAFDTSQDHDGFQSVSRALAFKAAEMARLSRQMHLALYDNGAQFSGGDEFRYGATVYVVPALNPAALNKERDTENQAEPWLSLQTVLYGSDDLLYNEAWPLESYEKRHINQVRSAWQKLAQAYTNRDNPGRPEAVERGQADLLLALAKLGKYTQSQRLELVEAELDEEQIDRSLLAYTAYPSPGRLDAEITYNRVKPFQWSWVICLGSVMFFGLSFGVLRRQMFWAAMAVLGLAILWSAYGFYLRVLVTQWAPVTNMYETVVFVPWVLAIMAVWFVVLPLIWTGLKDAWRLTAVPGTWEAGPLEQRQGNRFSAGTWSALGFVASALRLALMVWVFQQLAMVPYADGNRPVFYLVPDMSALDFNTIFVYLVNLLCLVALVWYVPRVMLTALASLVMVPLSWLESDTRQADRRAVAGMMPQVYSRWAFGLCGAAGAAFFFLIASYASVLDEDFRPLQPVLRSNFWLTIHVLTIVASYGAGMLAWLLGTIGLSYYLFGKYRDPVVAKNLPKGMEPAGGDHTPQRMAKLPPEETHQLAGYAYRAVQVAVLLLAAGTILGGLWADVSWGRFWGWDPKEVWALISLLVYLAILHGRFAGWFNNFAMIAGTVFGATMIAFSWYGVNFILPTLAGGNVGLHSYGEGEGGIPYVFGFIGLNFLYLAAATVRYCWETNQRVVPVQRSVESLPAELSGGEV